MTKQTGFSSSNITFTSDLDKLSLGYSVSTEIEAIEDYNDHVKCWGKTHALEGYSKQYIGRDRLVHRYTFECGRIYITENDLNHPKVVSVESKPEDACPGCCPSMEEISKWR